MTLTVEQMEQRAQALVISLCGQEKAQLWWSSPNEAFDYHSPQFMWRKDPRLVYQYLMHYAYR